MRSALVVALALVPSIAAAGPVSFGAGIGVSENQATVAQGSNETLGLFGRLGLASRLSLQLELARTQSNNARTDDTSGSALAVLDLAQGTWVPLLLAGAGLDRAGDTQMQTEAHHFEAGIGLELRSQGGFFVGADARIGELDIDKQPEVVALFCPRSGCGFPSLHAGEYRSVRATLGVRF
jgi:hypothetical protein